LKAFDEFLKNHNLILEQEVLARTADLRASERRFSDMLGNVDLVSVTHCAAMPASTRRSATTPALWGVFRYGECGGRRGAKHWLRAATTLH
jgi:hypothetical protein